MANKYISVYYDKFENKRETLLNYACGLYVNEYNKNDYLNLIIRHISFPGEDGLLLDLNYSGDDWFFLRSGILIININNIENIELDPHESYAETYNTGYSFKCKESDFYIINQEILKKICDAKSVEIKVTGKSVWVLNANGLIRYAQIFYNGFYDENAYWDALKEEEEMRKLIASHSNSSCLVTLLMAITTISSFAACWSFLIGLFFN